jgi:hypothetical protein
MTDLDDDPIEEILARSRDRAARLQAWFEHGATVLEARG